MATTVLCNHCLYKTVPDECKDCFFKPKEQYNPKKPPLGIMPKYIHDELRLRDLREAIARYMQAGVAVPIGWIEEYNQLVGIYK